MTPFAGRGGDHFIIETEEFLEGHQKRFVLVFVHALQEARRLPNAVGSAKSSSSLSRRSNVVARLDGCHSLYNQNRLTSTATNKRNVAGSFRTHPPQKEFAWKTYFRFRRSSQTPSPGFQHSPTQRTDCNSAAVQSDCPSESSRSRFCSLTSTTCAFAWTVLVLLCFAHGQRASQLGGDL